MINWLLLPKNRADVYVVTGESKQAVMVVPHSSPLLAEIVVRMQVPSFMYGGVLATSQRRPSLISLPHRLV
jgi:hypothetical protein